MSEENVQPEVEETEDSEVELEVDDSTEEEDGESVDWKARALKAESLIVKNKKEAKKEEEKPAADPKPAVTSSDSERLDRFELRQEGYSKEVIDEIMDLGGPQALENPIVRKAADDRQAQLNTEKATDIPEGSTGQTKTKYSKEDLENMTSEELEKILPHAE